MERIESITDIRQGSDDPSKIIIEGDGNPKKSFVAKIIDIKGGQIYFVRSARGRRELQVAKLAEGLEKNFDGG